MPFVDPLGTGTAGRLGDITGYQLQNGIVLSANTDKITLLLDAASSIVRTATGQTLSLVTGDTETCTPLTDSESLWLLEWPIVSVTSVTIDGNVVTDYSVDYALNRLVRTARCWPCGFGRIVVKYTHGYSVIPADIQNIVYNLARRMLENPSGQLFLMERLGQYEARYQPGVKGNALTDAEMEILQAYRPPRIA